MKLCEKIFANVISEKPIVLNGLIISIKVQSGTKNPYYILFPKTNSAGKTELALEDFIGQFQDHFEIGLMDYNGSVEEANPMVEVSLFDPTWSLQNRRLALAWPLLKHESTKWTSREEEYNYRISCRNLEFSFTPQSVDLEQTSTIELHISHI